MKQLRQAMQAQEQRNLWSLRWLIVGAFVQGGFLLYLSLGADGRAAVPVWALYAWGVLALCVAALAALAKSVHPKGGVLILPLGPAVAPRMPSLRPTPVASAPPEPAPAMAPATPANDAPAFAWGSPGLTARETAHQLAAHYSGLDLTARQDGGVWRLGYGHTFGITEGMTCTRAQAHAWLGADMESAFTVLDLWVTVPLTNNQRAALVDFVFSVGPGAEGEKDGFVWLASGEHSALYTKLQAGDYAGASAEFGAWNTCNGVALDGLTERRASERELFDTP